MLTVIEPAKSYDLTTTAALRAELEGLTSRDEADLRRHITQASGVIAAYCNRVFAIETVTETVRSRAGCGDFMLSRYPIVAVLSAANGDTVLPIDTFAIDKRSGCGERLRSDGWSNGWPNTTITYRAGYELPSGLPQGVERACILLAKSYALAGSRDPAVRSEAVEGAGTTEYFSGGGSGLPPEVAGLLDIHIKPNGPL